jgi:hypothetical protein
MKTAKYAALNAQIAVLDPGGKVDVPQWPRDIAKRLVSTDTCILVGCLIDADGETEFALGRVSEVDTGDRPAFQGKLKTPTRRIALESVDGRLVLDAPVSQEETMVSIWTNHESEPDKVIVGFE